MTRRVIDMWEELGVLDEQLETMRNLAYHGAKLSVIAKAVGVSVKTLERMRNPDESIYDARVYKALFKGRGALVGDIGRTLRDWVEDDKVPIEIRVTIAKDLYLKHGAGVLDLEDKNTIAQVKQLMGMVNSLEHIIKIKDMEIEALKVEQELAESGEGGEPSTGQRVFVLREGESNGE